MTELVNANIIELMLTVLSNLLILNDVGNNLLILLIS